MSTLVFIHGSGCTGEAFKYQTAFFAGSYAPNLPGHNAAGSAQSVAEFADYVETYLQERDLQDVVLCGNSLGGAVALEVGLRDNARVSALIALGSGSRLKVAPAVLEGLQNNFDATAQGLAGAMFASPTDDLVAGAVTAMKLVGQAQTLRDFAACNVFDVTERLPQLLVPLLALTGERDVMTPPKYAQFLADRVPRGEVRIIPAAGHLAMIERPTQANDAIANFVKRSR